jgi:beta-lactamase superfamily II metal-dependent hydrolase
MMQKMVDRHTQRLGISVLTALFFLITSPALAQRVGEVFPPWSPGHLDIHHISTGKGSAAFLLLPDGTTMLFDAGATSRPKPRVADPRPDDSRTPGGWIARYIRHMLDSVREPEIDFAVMSHFHDDHMGAFVDVAQELRVRTLLDRAWPEYDYPVPLEGGYMEAYRNLIEQQASGGGLIVERFTPGRNDQIVLLRDPERFPEFEVRNLAANGEIWTGILDQTQHHFPPLEILTPQDRPNENMCSIALRLSYGSFDYFTGGDLVGVPSPGSPTWHDQETPIAHAIGPVEVHVVNHHGYTDAANAYFLSELRPQVHILESWAPTHPTPSALSRLLSTRVYPGPRDIFSTNTMEVTNIFIPEGSMDRLASRQGHIVVRVAPGGDQYHVIILDDSSESYRVQAVHGPYQAR